MLQVAQQNVAHVSLARRTEPTDSKGLLSPDRACFRSFKARNTITSMSENLSNHIGNSRLSL